MSLHKLAKLMGFLFVLFGILGFIPGITENELLFGIFQVNAALNFFYILTGLIAFGVRRKEQKHTKYFFQTAGLVYMALALIGLAQSDKPVLGVLANNPADSWLHLWVSVAFLYIGFLFQNRRYKK